MDIGVINKYLKPAVENKTLYSIGSTSLKEFYLNRMKDIVFDDDNNVLVWKDTETNMLLFFDYSDINTMWIWDKDTAKAPYQG